MIIPYFIHGRFLKPMDSFGMWWKSNDFCFSSLNHNFIVLCELLMSCQLFAQKCSNLSRNNQNVKMFGVPPNTLPLVIYKGIFCYLVLLHYNMSFKTIAGGFNGAFWWYIWSIFLKIEKKINKSTKTIVALIFPSSNEIDAACMQSTIFPKKKNT